ATWPGRKPSAPSRTWWEWRVEGAGLTPPACRPTLLLGNGKGVALAFLGGTCGFFDDSFGRPELPRRDGDGALGGAGGPALVREAGKHGDLRQGQVAAPLQEVLRPLDTAGDDVLVRRQPGGRLELAGEVVGAKAGDRSHLLQGRVGVEVFLDIFHDGAELRS